MGLTVLRTGPLTVLKDAGRPGHAAQGVAPSGAVDRGAYARANLLIGNPPGTAALECTLGGLRVRFDEPAVIVLTGTDAVLTVDGRRTEPAEVVQVPAGTQVAVTTPRRGLRSYLAVRGGFDVPEVLGSRSTDQLGIGPPRPTAGDVLPIGPPPVPSSPLVPSATPPPSSAPPSSPPPSPSPPSPSPPSPSPPSPSPPSPSPPSPSPPSPSSPTVSVAARDAEAGDLPGGGPLILAVDLGPRDDWFTRSALDTFLTAEFTVATASDSVGLRLDGPALTRLNTDELPSEGVVRGSVQVPPDGHPIVFQADHPVTGGYPVIAVLTPAAADLAAQARPGASVRFTLSDPGPADRSGG